MKRTAFLYCTHGHDFWYIGEIEDEGSFEKLIQEHIELTNEYHRETIHITIEGSPEYEELSNVTGFPTFNRASYLMGEAREIVGLTNHFNISKI